MRCSPDAGGDRLGPNAQRRWPSVLQDDFHFLLRLDLDLFQRRKALGFEGEFLLALVRRVSGIAQFLEQQRNGPGVGAAQCLPAQADLTDGVGASFDRELVEKLDDPFRELIVHADDALAFGHGFFLRETLPGDKRP